MPTKLGLKEQTDFTSRIRNLHIIRGIACLIVVFFHAKWVLWVGGSTWRESNGLDSISDILVYGISILSNCGKQAVACFFILSAFVITHVLKKNPSKKLFAITRVIRIYIPYFASIVLSLIVLYAVYPYLKSSGIEFTSNYLSHVQRSIQTTDFKTIVNSIVFLPGTEYIGYNPVYWSLFYELIFYLVIPFLFYRSNKSLFVIMLSCIGLTYVPVISSSAYYLIYFIIGIIWYNFFKTKYLTINKIFSLILMTILYVGICYFASYQKDKIADILTLPFVFLSFNMVFSSHTNQGEKKNIIEKFLFFLADISYSLYLIHMPVLLLLLAIYYAIMKTVVIDNPLVYYVSVPIMIAITIPFYRWFELPSINLIRKYKKGLSQKQTPNTQVELPK